MTDSVDLCHILVGAQLSGILSLLYILWYTKYTSPSFVYLLVKLPDEQSSLH